MVRNPETQKLLPVLKRTVFRGICSQRMYLELKGKCLEVGTEMIGSEN